LWANPFGSGIKEGLAPCFGEAPANEIDRFSVEDWEPFADLTGEVLDAIVAARAGAPTVVRVTDLYVPVMTQWRDRGILEICMAGMETMSDALRMVAAEHGATFVSSLDVYNGPEHQTDPVEAGFIRGDGLHPSAAGGQAMAEALAAVGFEPSPAPTS
ncbi:SGNH/GDSL hydrolase family protein, partial [Tessaracoccus lapidicaptus]|uniref:SGNH/GDSL hydrolase family protein n=1 Tax=Tessaracoccus lapidicaptus TaxID=1427523 RepID=UPI00333F0BFD